MRFPRFVRRGRPLRLRDDLCCQEPRGGGRKVPADGQGGAGEIVWLISFFFALLCVNMFVLFKVTFCCWVSFSLQRIQSFFCNGGNNIPFVNQTSISPKKRQLFFPFSNFLPVLQRLRRPVPAGRPGRPPPARPLRSHRLPPQPGRGRTQDIRRSRAVQGERWEKIIWLLKNICFWVILSFAFKKWRRPKFSGFF